MVMPSRNWFDQLQKKLIIKEKESQTPFLLLSFSFTHKPQS